MNYSVVVKEGEVASGGRRWRRRWEEYDEKVELKGEMQQDAGWAGTGGGDEYQYRGPEARPCLCLCLAFLPKERRPGATRVLHSWAP